MICTVCKEEKAEKHYHADNKTGWSKLCLSCRKKRNNRVYTRRYRLKKKLIAQTEVTNIAQTQHTLVTQEHYLKKQFKRFTLLNRTRIKQLTKKLDTETPDPRTIEAFERRMKRQLEAIGILNGQIAMVRIGITPKHIEELWRMNHGEHARSESEEQNQEDTRCEGDLSLLSIYGGDGEVRSS